MAIGSAAGANQSTASGVDEPAAERGDAAGGVQAHEEGYLDPGKPIGEKDLAPVRFGAGLEELQLGEEAAGGPVDLDRRMAGEAARGFGKEVEDLPCVQHSVRYRAFAQRLDRIEVDLVRQCWTPIGQHRRSGTLGDQHGLAAAVESEHDWAPLRGARGVRLTEAQATRHAANPGSRSGRAALSGESRGLAAP